MKLDVSKISFSKEQVLTENVKFDQETFKCYRPLIEVLNCKVEVKTQRFEEFIYVTLSIVADVILECSYSLKHFKKTLKANDELHFSSIKDEDDDDIIIFKGNVIDLDSYIFDLISASVPVSPRAPGVKGISSGDGYRVISDEELKANKESSSPFDALKDLDL